MATRALLYAIEKLFQRPCEQSDAALLLRSCRSCNGWARSAIEGQPAVLTAQERRRSLGEAGAGGRHDAGGHAGGSKEAGGSHSPAGREAPAGHQGSHGCPWVTESAIGSVVGGAQPRSVLLTEWCMRSGERLKKTS